MVGETQDPPEGVGLKSLYHQAGSAMSRALNEVWQGMMVMMVILTRNRPL